MAESQNVELEKSWRGAYLKCTCDFVNLLGRKICSGINSGVHWCLG